MPRIAAPEGIAATGLRTVGGKRPERIPLGSVSRASRLRSNSHGMNCRKMLRLVSRCCSGDVRKPRRSHRFVEGRFFRVSLEETADVALAGGDHDQFAFARQNFEFGDAGVDDAQIAAEALEFFQPPRHLHPLVDRLGRSIEALGPAERSGAVLADNSDFDAFNRRGDIITESDHEITFMLASRIELALA